MNTPSRLNMHTYITQTCTYIHNYRRGQIINTFASLYMGMYTYCDVLPESRNIGFGPYRRIRHNVPLKALRGQQLIETFPKQRESKTCFHSIGNSLRRCSLFRRPEPTSREDREHSDDSRVNFQSIRAFGGFRNTVGSQSVQCPQFRVDALNSVKCFSSGTIRKCDIRL
jgi:hypothetical protein